MAARATNEANIDHWNEQPAVNNRCLEFSSHCSALGKARTQAAALSNREQLLVYERAAI